MMLVFDRSYLSLSVACALICGASISDAQAQGSLFPTGFRSEVERDGLTLLSLAEGSWRLHLETETFGRAGSAEMLKGGAPRSVAGRIEIDHGSLVEWFVHNELGIEQGWTIACEPDGEGALVIGMRLGGEVAFHLDAGGRSGFFTGQGGERIAHYRGLVAWDADGRELDATLVAVPGGVEVRVDAGGARYPITVDPLLTTSAWSVAGAHAKGHFGFSVASAGDVNGDGFDDVIVGAPDSNSGSAAVGRAYVFHGSASGLSVVAAWSQSFPGLAQDFGEAVAGVGDVNGDGFGDVVVGAPGFGMVFGYFGSATGLSLTEDWKLSKGGAYGTSIAGAGDVNGDGFGDVIIGDPTQSAPFFNEGRVHVYHGSAAGLGTLPDWSKDGPGLFASFGQSVDGAGDVNGDGFADVIIGAPNHSNPESLEGAAYVFLGSSSGLSSVASWSAEGNLATGAFGGSVAGAGDVNGDGFSDVIVGASYYDGFSGRAFAYHGSGMGLGLAAVWTGSVGSPLAYYGGSVASAGDVDGDGFGDVIVGSIGFGSIPGFGSGGALVYRGSSAGLGTLQAWQYAATELTAGAGKSVASAGDVNGDGVGDIIIGAYYHSTALLAEVGQALVFHGSGTPTYPPVGLIHNGSGANQLCLSSQPPVLGQTWISTVETQVDPAAIGSFLAVYGSYAAGQFLPGGEVLVNLASPQYLFMQATAIGPSTIYSVPIPAIAALAGLNATAQAGVFGTNLTFCNGYRFTIGK